MTSPRKLISSHPPLSDELATATQGHSALYSPWFKSHSHEFHTQGINWPESELAKFFSEGLLQFYVGQLIGINLNASSQDEMKQNASKASIHPVWSIRTFQSFVEGGKPKLPLNSLNPDPSQFLIRNHSLNRWAPLTMALLAPLRSQTYLLTLGTCFQYAKLRLEELHNRGNSNFGMIDEHNIQTTLRIDRDIDLIQTAIYWWVLDYRQQMISFIKSYDGPGTALTAITEFKPKEPDFISQLEGLVPTLRSDYLPKAEKKQDEPIRNNQNTGDTSMSSPRALRGLINEYPFQGQHQLRMHLKGCVPCTSIAIATASRLLRMDDNDFFKTFPPEQKLEGKAKDHATTQLSGCVQTGIDLNGAISSQDANFFTSTINLVTRKAAQEVMKGIQNLKENVGGVKEAELLDTIGVRVKDKPELEAFYPSKLDNFRDEIFKEYKEKFKLNPSDIFFVATAGGHTIAFFSRKDKQGNEYFYLTDSRDTFTTGKMEVHDSWQSAMNSLLKKWEKADYADISILTLKGLKLGKDAKNDMEEKKNEEPQNKMEEIIKAIKAFKDMPADSRLSRWQQVLGNKEEGLERAISYLNLLNQNDTELQRYIVVLGLLSNDRSTQLRKAVSMALVFGDEKDDIKHAKKEMEKSIFDILKVDKMPNEIQEALKKVNAYANFTTNNDPKKSVNKLNLENEAIDLLTNIKTPTISFGNQ